MPITRSSRALHSGASEPEYARRPRRLVPLDEDELELRDMDALHAMFVEQRASFDAFKRTLALTIAVILVLGIALAVSEVRTQVTLGRHRVARPPRDAGARC